MYILDPYLLHTDNDRMQARPKLSFVSRWRKWVGHIDCIVPHTTFLAVKLRKKHTGPKFKRLHNFCNNRLISEVINCLDIKLDI